MALRTGHGTGAGQPRVEVLPADELPAGVPAQAVPLERTPDGRVAGTEAARELGRRGGKARAARRADARAWGASFGLGRMLDWAEDESLRPFVVEGEAWLRGACESVARDTGGGQLSPGVVSILRTASWQRLFSAFLFDASTRTRFAWEVDAERTPKVLPRTELMAMAARLGNASRQNLLGAHELAAREAESRPRTNGVVELRARMLGAKGAK